MSLLFCIVSVYAIAIYCKCVRANKILSIVYFFWLGFHKNKAIYKCIVPSKESLCFYKRNSSAFEVLDTTFNIRQVNNKN